MNFQRKSLRPHRSFSHHPSAHRITKLVLLLSKLDVSQTLLLCWSHRHHTPSLGHCISQALPKRLLRILKRVLLSRNKGRSTRSTPPKPPHLVILSKERASEKRATMIFIFLHPPPLPKLGGNAASRVTMQTWPQRIQQCTHPQQQ